MLGGNVLYLSRVCEHMHACASLHRCELNCKGFKHISSVVVSVFAFLSVLITELAQGQAKVQAECRLN